jgi:hypothetical protein
MQSFRQNSKERIFLDKSCILKKFPEFYLMTAFSKNLKCVPIRQIYLINWYIILKYKTKDVIQKK